MSKEVGGDLYSYLIQGDMLYFCVGDVSGKGVPSSLFMAQATQLFRTLAAQQMMPAEICTRMNDDFLNMQSNAPIGLWEGLSERRKDWRLSVGSGWNTHHRCLHFLSNGKHRRGDSHEVP